jgi:RNA polymerase sigma factor (sigma-70 family)
LDDIRKIVDACVSGDNRAHERLYRMLAPKMFGVCLRYAKDAAEAEDNLHDGFITVFTKLKDFRHEGSFEGWVRRIMVNTSLNKYRNHLPVFYTDDMQHHDASTHAEEAMSNLPLEDLVKTIQELPPQYRMVFNLYVMEGFNHQEISRELGISEGTSKSNLSRAREILRTKLESRYGERKKKRRYPI